ncbi:hypothetical protein C0995_005130 [Termitomyces sp. Mi166|nr:hypothetical protein C0995_005130 [Termitomyces sp. Mi166\
MARALLRRSSIIVLDEAISSIDFATDAKTQTTVREESTSSLLLTIAHRLCTVIDYDRLIVLDKEQIVKFDTPWKLIKKKYASQNPQLHASSGPARLSISTLFTGQPSESSLDFP